MITRYIAPDRVSLQPGECAGMIRSAFDRITMDPAKLNGQPCIRGMRLTVRRVLVALAARPDREESRREYPELEDEDVRQALQFAAANLFDEADSTIAPP